MNPDATRWDGGHVTCPACGREGYTDKFLNLCAGCQRWFVVDPEPPVTTEVLADADVGEVAVDG